MDENCNKSGWWCQYSERRLVELENKLLTIVKTAYRTWFVPIGSNIGNDDKIWTIALNEQGTKTPLVLLHGFGAGIGLWCMNFDEIAKDRPVYAIDLLGFGRSSRPNFASDCETAEQQWVSTIEAWRKQLKMDKFILLGHSFGGYLATSYAINYPNRVKHLILADPWGFSERMLRRPPLWVRAIGLVLYPLTYLNPLATVRAVGPFGPWFIRKLRSDLARKYEEAFDEKDIITEYIYHCNAQYPSGEAAFHSFIKGFGWAKNPMVKRLDRLYDDIPITVIYGEYSWIDKGPGRLLQDKKKFVNVEVIPDAGHQVYSDQPKLFNRVVNAACFIADNPNERKRFFYRDVSPKNAQKNDVVYDELDEVQDDISVDCQ